MSLAALVVMTVQGPKMAWAIWVSRSLRQPGVDEFEAALIKIRRVAGGEAGTVLPRDTGDEEVQFAHPKTRSHTGTIERCVERRGLLGEGENAPGKPFVEKGRKGLLQRLPPPSLGQKLQASPDFRYRQ